MRAGTRAIRSATARLPAARGQSSGEGTGREPDDGAAPRGHNGTLIVSRLLLGAGAPPGGRAASPRRPAQYRPGLGRGFVDPVAREVEPEREAGVLAVRSE